jgi:hypothetical protein
VRGSPSAGFDGGSDRVWANGFDLGPDVLHGDYEPDPVPDAGLASSRSLLARPLSSSRE